MELQRRAHQGASAGGKSSSTPQQTLLPSSSSPSLVVPRAARRAGRKVRGPRCSGGRVGRSPARAVKLAARGPAPAPRGNPAGRRPRSKHFGVWKRFCVVLTLLPTRPPPLFALPPIPPNLPIGTPGRRCRRVGRQGRRGRPRAPGDRRLLLLRHCRCCSCCLDHLVGRCRAGARPGRAGAGRPPYSRGPGRRRPRGAAQGARRLRGEFRTSSGRIGLPSVLAPPPPQTHTTTLTCSRSRPPPRPIPKTLNTQVGFIANLRGLKSHTIVEQVRPREAGA